MRACLPLLPACISLLGLAEAPPKPILEFPHFGIMDRNTAGSSLSLAEGRACYWEGSSLYDFNPDLPFDRSLKVIDLGEGAHHRSRATVFSGTPYTSDGKTIRIWNPKTRKASAKPWFEFTGQFHRFEVLDRNTVALLWTEPKGKESEPLFFAKSAKEVQELGIHLLEIWDQETGTRRDAVPVPTDILELLETFQPFAFGDLRLFRSGDYLLILVPVLGRAYDYDTAKKRFTRLSVPWDEVDLAWIRPHLAQGQSITTYAFFPGLLPTMPVASPASNGGIRLASWITPLREDQVARMAPDALGATKLFPRKPLPASDTGATAGWRFMEWTPGKTAIQEVKPTAVIDFNDPLELERRGLTSMGRGIYSDPTGETIPMTTFLAQLNAAAERLKKSQQTP